MHVAALAAAALIGGWTQVGAGPNGGTVWSGRIPNTYARWDMRSSEIYLPPGYDSSRRYPVLYLLHGLVGSPNEYWHALHLAERLDGLLSGGGAQPFIVVTPVGGQVVNPNRGEWAGIWEDYVVHDVVPWVDAYLSTLASPSARAIEGLCAGGYGAVDIGLRHPDVFGAVGSWEGYFTPFRDGPFTHATRSDLRAHTPTLLARSEAPRLRRDGTTFYLSAGGNHGPIRERWTTAFANELHALRLPVELRLFAQGHVWSGSLPSALQFAAHELRLRS